MKLIGADELAAAAEGHFGRLELHGPDPFARILESIGVDHGEFAQLVATIRGLREDTGMTEEESDAYAAIFIDGFVIGIRAARISEGVAI